MVKRILALASCFLFPMMPGTAAAAPQDVEPFVTRQMTERHIVGAGVAVLHKGQVVKVGSYGYIDLLSKKRTRPSTLHNAASITKSFTGVAIMTLVEAKRLQLGDPVGMHLQNLPTAWRDIPVRRLLNHTSGLPDMTRDAVSTRMIGATAAETLSLLADRPLDFPVGARYSYNQTNYLLLGMMIEKLSGRSYVQYLREKVLAPGGVRDAVFGDSRLEHPRLSPLYTPFRFDAGPRPTVLDHVEPMAPEFWELPPFAYPAGGLNISVQDFARWLSRLLAGRIVSRESLRELWTPAQLADGTVFKRPPSGSLWDGSGLGWVLGTDAEHPFAGGTGGVRSAFFYYPKDDVAVIVLTNTQGSGPESLAAGIAREYLSRERASQ